MGKLENDEMEKRILAAAQELFVHYGYDKTTMSEIAEKAGIAKSTLYLRWKKKDALFEALVWQESRSYAEDWFRRVEEDPNGGTYGAWMRHALESFFGRPFLAALYRQDRRVLGTMFQKIGESKLFLQRYMTGLQFFQQMQAANLARKDIDIRSFVYLVNAMHFGLLHLGDMIPEEVSPPINQSLNVMAEIIEAYVTPPEGGDNEKGKQVLRDYMARVRTILDELENK